MAIQRKYRLNLRNYGNLPAIMLSQYDEGYDLVFEIYDGPDAAENLSAYTVKLCGTRRDTLKYELTGTIANNVLSFPVDTTMSACDGKGVAEIEIIKAADDTKFATFNLPVFVEKAAVPNDAVDADVERAQEIAEQVQELIDGATYGAEAWATGQKNGVDVETTDPTYHNNSKYYAEQAQEIADSIGIDATLSITGKAADAKKTGDEISSLKEDLSEIEDALYESIPYSLVAPASITVPANAKEQQSVTFAISGTTDNAKIITNKVASGNLPYTPPTNGVKTFNTSNGFIDSVTGSNIYIIFHVTNLSIAALSITGSGTGHVYTESGTDSGGKDITSNGWYYIKTDTGFSTGYHAKESYTFDHMVAVDSAELEERYPDIVWDIGTFIENFPAQQYGTLSEGETYTPQATSGAIAITHDGTTTSYTGTSATAAVYPNDMIACTVGSVIFNLKLAGTSQSEAVDGKAALLFLQNNTLVYKGEATDSVIASLTNPSVGDAYLYKTSVVHGLYKEPVCNGDILFWNGTDWCTLRFNPSTFDIYENERHYDVVIVGGGAGGIGAAYALKDSGLDVCLIESLDTLGGTHVNAGVIQLLSSPVPDFLKDIMSDLLGAGMAEASSVKSYGGGSDTAFDKAWRGGYITPSGGRGTTYSINPWAISKRYYDDLVAAGIDVLLGCDFVSLSATSGGVCESITIRDRHSGKTEVIWGYYFIDATSFGSICTYGKTQGTDYYTGTDSNARFGESAISASYVPDVKQVNSAEADYMIEVTSSSHAAPRCKVTDAFGAKQGLWSIPNAIGKTIQILSTDGSDRTAKYIFDPSYNAGGYHYAVNQSKNRTKDHFKKYFGATSVNRFIKTMPLIAMRETNRVVCDDMIVQDDITTLATSANYAENHYIALASWGWDLHNSTGVDENALPTSARLCGLPYECIIPVAYKNVLVASKCFGASHIALSYFRLTKTCMSIGWAAGKAALLAVTDGYIDDVRDVDIDDLQTAIGIGDLLSDIEAYYTLT